MVGMNAKQAALALHLANAVPVQCDVVSLGFNGIRKESWWWKRRKRVGQVIPFPKASDIGGVAIQAWPDC
jgi:hypothetical protein